VKIPNATVKIPNATVKIFTPNISHFLEKQQIFSPIWECYLHLALYYNIIYIF
jgi:hypothetical protein